MFKNFKTLKFFFVYVKFVFKANQIPEISKDATTSGQKTKQQPNKNVPATQPTKTKQKKENPKTNKLQPHTLQSSDKNCKVLASCQLFFSNPNPRIIKH